MIKRSVQGELNAWATICTVSVVLRTDAATGQVTVSKNGVQKGTITGQPTKYYTNHTDIYLNVVVRAEPTEWRISIM